MLKGAATRSALLSITRKADRDLDVQTSTFIVHPATNILAHPGTHAFGQSHICLSGCTRTQVNSGEIRVKGGIFQVQDFRGSFDIPESCSIEPFAEPREFGERVKLCAGAYLY
jgi:hypothetical protein